MKLYFSPGTCSLSAHIVLREAQLPFDLVKVDLYTHTTESGSDFHSVNPKGSVPVLETDAGERLTEGPIIAQYLADLAGREDLLPKAGTMARYRIQEWQNYITSEIHKSFSTLFNPSFDATAMATQRGVLRRKYEWLSSELSQRPFVSGHTFTVADPYLFTVTSWSGTVGLELGDLAPLQSYVRTIAARPSVQAAMRAEGIMPQ